MRRNIILNPFRFSFSLFIDDGNEGGGGSADDAVKKAAKDLAEKKDPPVKDEKETKVDDEPTDEEVEELKQAKELLKTLKDPASRKILIQTLAEREGITADSSKKEIKVATKNIKSIIKEHLGEEYEILSDRLEKILSESFDLFDTDRVKPIKDNLSNKEIKEVQSIAEKAYDKVFSEFSNSKSLEKAVEKLCDEIKPGKDQSPELYFRRLLKIAAEEGKVALLPVSTKENVVKNFNEEKRKINARDASSRLASEGADEGKVHGNPKSMNLNEAIEKAAQEAEKLLKK